MIFNSKWYSSLIKPYLTPPAFIFRPIWSILYFLIFISLIIYILKNSEFNKFRGYLFFGIQMILNGLWSPIFFYFQNMKLALICIILMDVFLILTIKEFYKISKPASLILIPYLVWILFATYLNFGYILVNK